MRPFARDDAALGSGPLPAAGKAYARDLAEVKRWVVTVSPPRSRSTADQTRSRCSGKEPPAPWNRIARPARIGPPLDAWGRPGCTGSSTWPWQTATSVLWDQVRDPFWRPVTAIQVADHDGNKATTVDPTWTPLVTTPPIPDHDSAHAVQGGAAAAVFRSFFGTDRMSFDQCSNTLPGGRCGDPDEVRRQFSSFSQAAQENASSRVYIGFHFRHATEVGLAHGDRIGRQTARNTLALVRR